jgi:mannose-6-phosphate isomerase-like protein (cupin superfamily)
MLVAAQAPQTPQTPPQAKPPQTPPAAKPPQTTPSPQPNRPTTSTGRLTLSVLTTAMDGKTIPEVWVKASGPVDREGATDPSGNVTFNNIVPGSYRLRFEHDRFVTLERDVTVLRGQPFRGMVSLNAAPPPPPPPKAEPVAPPPAPTPAPAGNYQPSSTDIPDLVEKNFIGGAAIKRSTVGCTASSTATVIQLRDPLAEHSHADQDELIYVVAGEGSHRIAGHDYQLSGGVFSAVPRGTTHSITRRGRQPLVLISTLSGTPCQPGQ